MTRDELRHRIISFVTYLKEESFERSDDAEEVDTIMALVDTYCVGIVQESSRATVAQRLWRADVEGEA